MKKINIRKCDKWEDLPAPWVKVTRPKVINPAVSLTDEDFKKLFEPYYGGDELRPNLMCLNVDDDVVVATDAHSLIIYPIATGSIEKGLYVMTKEASKATGVAIGKTHNKNYPNYRAVVASNTQHQFEVDLIKLKTYCEAVIKGKYASEYSNAIACEVFGSEFATYNAKMLVKVCDTFISLGHTQVWMGMNEINKSTYYSVSKKAVEKPATNIGKELIVLQMPIIEVTENQRGAIDIDYDTELSVYYSFLRNNIVNASGVLSNFNPNATSTELDYITKEKLSLVKKFLPTNHTIHIMEYVCVRDNTLYASNLSESIIIEDAGIENGMYEYVNGALKDTTQDIDNYPNILDRIGNMQQLGAGPADVWAHILEHAVNFVSTDKLRPITMGIRYASYNNDAHVSVLANNSVSGFKKKLNRFHTNNLPIDISVSSPAKQLAAMETMTGDVVLSANDNRVQYINANEGIIAVFDNLGKSLRDEFDSAYAYDTTEVITYNVDDITAAAKACQKDKSSFIALTIPPIGISTNAPYYTDLSTSPKGDIKTTTSVKSRSRQFFLEDYIVLAPIPNVEPTFFYKLRLPPVALTHTAKVPMEYSGRMEIHYKPTANMSMVTLVKIGPVFPEKKVKATPQTAKPGKKPKVSTSQTPSSPTPPAPEPPPPPPAAAAKPPAEPTREEKIASIDKLIETLNLARRYAPSATQKIITQQINNLKTAKKYI